MILQTWLIFVRKKSKGQEIRWLSNYYDLNFYNNHDKDNCEYV